MLVVLLIMVLAPPCTLGHGATMVMGRRLRCTAGAMRQRWPMILLIGLTMVLPYFCVVAALDDGRDRETVDLPARSPWGFVFSRSAAPCTPDKL